MASEVKSLTTAVFSTDLQELMEVLEQRFSNGTTVVYCTAHHMTQRSTVLTDLSAAVRCSPVMIEVAKKIFVVLRRAASLGHTSTKFTYDNFFLETCAVLDVFQKQMSLTGYHLGIPPNKHSDFCPIIHTSRRMTIMIMWELTNRYLGHKSRLPSPSCPLLMKQEREDQGNCTEEIDTITAKWQKMDIRQKIAFIRKAMKEEDLDHLQEIDEFCCSTRLSLGDDDPAIDTFYDAALELEHRIWQLHSLRGF